MERLTYKVKEAAKMLGVSVRTVQRYVKAGRLIAVRFGGSHPLILAKSLEDFLQAKPQEPVKQKLGNSTRRAE